MKKIILCFVSALTIFSGCEKIVFKDPSTIPNTTDTTPPTVTVTDPANTATGISLNQPIVITFSEAMNPSTINNSTVTLSQGTTPVAATVSYSDNNATLTLAGNLAPNKAYTGTVTKGAKDAAGNSLNANYTFNFTTGATPDVTPPVVSSSDPANSATSVALSKIVTVTFNEAMDPLSITTSTFTLKHGTTVVSGTVSYTGTQASFVSSGNLTPSTVYTGTITTGAKDAAGNALASNYTFSFTTSAAADVTPPTLVSITPASSATGVSTSQVIGITFSEAMTASTINTTTFTVKQGTTAVAGTVGYSGTTATFTPSAALSAGTVYTAAISTGAKDLAGNALAAVSSWNFTTAGTAPAPDLSFATDVIPVLNMCENCHNHGWTTSSVASTYYTNLVNKGYVKPTSYTSSTIYTKLQNGHPGTGSISKANTDKIINWMIQGSKNN
jgi:hypothetical protein